MRVERNGELEELLIRLGLELSDRMKLLKNYSYSYQTPFLKRLILCRVYFDVCTVYY
jgi:hypothetical protein